MLNTSTASLVGGRGTTRDSFRSRIVCSSNFEHTLRPKLKKALLDDEPDIIVLYTGYLTDKGAKKFIMTYFLETYRSIINDLNAQEEQNLNKKFNLRLKDSIISKQSGNFSISEYYFNGKNTLYIKSNESSVSSLNINTNNFNKLFNGKEGNLYILNQNILCSIKKIKYYPDYSKKNTEMNSSMFNNYIWIDSLIIKKLNTRNTLPLKKVNKLLKKRESSIGEIIAFPSNENILISNGIMEQGGYLNPKYYLYNIHTNSLSEFKIPKELQSTFGEHGVWLSHYNLDKSYAFLDSTIIDSNFNYYSSYLRGNQASDIRGFVFSDNELKRLIVISEIDKKDRYGTPTYVLIQYTPSPHRERIMYCLYHNKIIAREELKQFDAFELRLFRNMIFAKYNYDFNDQYLTAYFNMYGFYRPHKETRTKDMSGKLTEADKQNLKLIKSMENEK